MTRFSARYAAALGAVVALVLLPATLRSLLSDKRSDCVVPVAELLEPSNFDAWSEILEKGSRPSDLEHERLVAVVRDPERPRPIVYSVVRFTALANALLQPPAALPGMREPDRVESRLLETEDGPIPVGYGFEFRGSQIRTTAHFMTYEGEPIVSPLWTRVRGSLDALRSGPLPINLFVVSGFGHTSDQARVEERLDGWMRNAWNVYRDVCRGGVSLGEASLGASAGGNS